MRKLAVFRSDPSALCINSKVLKPGQGFMMEVPEGTGVIIPSAL